MNPVNRLSIGLKAARALGWRQVLNYAVYQLARRSGWLRRRMPVNVSVKPRPWPVKHLFILPDREDLCRVLGPEGVQNLTAEADEIVAGEARLFGGAPVPINLRPPMPLMHALEYGCTLDGKDIKLWWEPARFGWAVVLARAYYLTGDPRYPEVFWRYLKEFIQENPFNLGPNWSSGQEIAIRLMAIMFAAQVMAPTADRAMLETLAGYVAQCASRLPVTFIYARAQNNNHWITEALGLWAAGVWLEHSNWQKAGWKWLNRGLQQQIEADGTYIQQSNNYHRLMLQAALWMDWIARGQGVPLDPATRLKLTAATGWLAASLDRGTGQVANLGHNDGALILPLACGGYADYRPTLQAAFAAFRSERLFNAGAWDEAGCWLGLKTGERLQQPMVGSVNRIEDQQGWASLRAVRYKNRPAHADQAHVEIWWRGRNLALDAGTYAYNLPAPWENALTSAAVHNTIRVDGQEPMLRAGKYLWLDWDQAQLADDGTATKMRIAMNRSGYAVRGLQHQRVLELIEENHWRITDRITPVGADLEHCTSIQWLICDGEWNLVENTLKVALDIGKVKVELGCDGGEPAGMSLVRAGESLAGAGGDAQVIRGWYSPTYALKVPALSLQWTVRHRGLVTLTTDWYLMPNLRMGE